jgi:hypothetical protein
VNQYGKAVDSLNFGRRGVEAFNVDFPPGEYNGYAIKQPDMILGVNGNGIFFLCHRVSFWCN